MSSSKYFILLALSVLLSCSPIITMDLQRDFQINPKIELIKVEDGSVINITLASSGKNVERNYQIFQSVKSISMEVLDNNSLIKNYSIDSIIIAGEPLQNSSSFVVLFAKKELKLNLNDYNGIEFKFIIKTDKSERIIVAIQKYQDIIFDSANGNILDLYPIIERFRETDITFGIFAVRKKMSEEYIPNSEIIRASVLNDKYKPVWNSSYGSNFMQVIYPVFPEKIGDSYKYMINWNLKDFSKRKGQYNIEFVIPALPKPYFTSFDLFWDGL